MNNNNNNNNPLNRNTTTEQQQQQGDAEKAAGKPSNLRRQPSKLDNARIRQMLQDEERLQQHLQPLFYAMLRGSPLEREQQKKKEQQQQQQQKQQSAQPPKIEKKAKQQSPRLPAITAPPPVAAPQRIPIDDYIPQQHQDIRQTAIFAQLYRQIQFQRDQYLVGPEYATWQHKERSQAADDIVQADPNDRLPNDPTALGPLQLTRILADFVPTETVRTPLVPLVTPLVPQTLYPIVQRATQDVILSQQANLNDICKSSLLAFLKNPQNRLAIKKSTHGFIETKYNEGE